MYSPHTHPLSLASPAVLPRHLLPSHPLCSTQGISDAKLEKLLEAARKMVGCGFVSGLEALVRQKARIKITTGSSELDKLLGGGLETGTVTEFFGEFRTGKTQIASTMCVTAQLGREYGGGAGKVRGLVLVHRWCGGGRLA